jgi:hypothetical protein
VNDAAAAGPAREPGTLGIATAPIAPPPLAGDGAELPTTLPRDHPAWARDVLAVSARARAILAQLRPVAVRALTFWDHLTHRVRVGARSVEVDPSGCYRVR